MRALTAEIGEHIDDLVDLKLMVIRRLEANPELANRIFLEVGRRELRYQVLEAQAQAQVAEPLERGGRTARTVRRSIVLTPFGEDFCAICLPLES